jgi:hypothetical protein
MGLDGNGSGIVRSCGSFGKIGRQSLGLVPINCCQSCETIILGLEVCVATLNQFPFNELILGWVVIHSLSN